MSLITPKNIIYSKRKTLSLQITKDAELIVRAPNRANLNLIHDFIQKKQIWIQNTIKRVLERKRNTAPNLGVAKSEEVEVKKKARVLLKSRLDHWSEVMDLNYTKFRLSSANTRWGSCSGKNVISLNWRLALVPLELLDYVAIHELAHVKEKNHSKSFWDLVGKFDLDFKNHKNQLKGYQFS